MPAPFLPVRAMKCRRFAEVFSYESSFTHKSMFYRELSVLVVPISAGTTTANALEIGVAAPKWLSPIVVVFSRRQNSTIRIEQRGEVLFC